MIVDVDLIVFNCIFSRAVNLNRCFIDKIILHHGTYIFYFFEKKTPGCPGGFTEDAPLCMYVCPSRPKNSEAIFCNGERASVRSTQSKNSEAIFKRAKHAVLSFLSNN